MHRPAPNAYGLRSRQMTAGPAHVTRPFRWEMGSRIADIEPLLRAFSDWGETCAVPPRTMGSIVLILDELVTNIIMHGYGPGGDGRIEVAAQRRPGAVQVLLTDEARAFNPLDVPEPDVTLGIDDREVGGLGLLFVRRTADTLAYERASTQGAPASNKLEFTKSVPTP